MNNKFICLLISLAFVGGEIYAAEKHDENKREEIAFYAPAEDEIDVWVDHAAEEFAGGEGTETAPYKIQTAAQFAKIAKDMFFDTSITYENTWFVIENDIDMSGYQWFPIGYMGEDAGLGKVAFAGKVDGQGHKICNINIPSFGNFKSMGLFGYTSKDFELKNLIMQSGTISGEMQTGSFVGNNSGLIKNCVNYVDVTCLMYYAGGIVGSTTSTGKITQCLNYGDIQAGHQDTHGLSAGGIAGTSSSIIEQCINWGDIKAMTNGAGGIVAMMDGGKISQCANRGSLNTGEQVGGIAAAVLGRTAECEITNCYSAAEFSENCKVAVGGIIGIGMMNYPRPFTLKNNYFDFQMFNGAAIGEFYDNFGMSQADNNNGVRTDFMTGTDFITTLNNESEGNEVWIADGNNINNGYPIFEFMKDFIPSGISSVASDDNVRVIAQNNSIQLTGLDNNTNAEVYSTNGLRMFYGNVSELAATYFNNGIYIVKANNKVYKVCIR